MKNSKRNSGYSLIDFVIAMTIMIIVGVLFQQLLLSFSGVQYNLIKKMQMSAHLNLTLVDVDIRLANAAKLDPGEDITGLTGQLLYKGIFPLQSNADFPECKIDTTAGVERHALRVSYINNNFRPLKTLNPWSENSIPPANTIRMSYLTTADGKFVFVDGSKNVDEILLIDGDDLGARRFRVNTVVPMASTPIDPYDLLPKAPPPFSYNIVTVKQPLTSSGVVKVPDAFKNISGSVVYGLATEVICSKDTGEIITINDNGLTKTSNIIFSPPSGAELTRFRFSYYNTKKAITVTNAVFYDYPYADLTKQSCINVIRLEVEFKETANGKIHKFGRVFMLKNFNDARPALCQT